jgi:hypothetical protein
MHQLSSRGNHLMGRLNRLLELNSFDRSARAGSPYLIHRLPGAPERLRSLGARSGARIDNAATLIRLGAGAEVEAKFNPQAIAS